MYQVGTGEDAVPTIGTLYFSNQPYAPAGGPPYLDALRTDSLVYARSLDLSTLTGKESSSISTLEFDNSDHGIDWLLALATDGSDVRCYTGSVLWPRSQMIYLWKALVGKCDAPSLPRLSISLLDMTLFLNKSIGGTVVVGGTGPEAESYRDRNFGYVHQTKPKLVESAPAFKYAHSDTGVNTAAVKVRADGFLLTETTDWGDNSDGTFDLVGDPNGAEITCDVLSYKPGGTPTDYLASQLID